jgi:CheY-like chemotaxis protein
MGSILAIEADPKRRLLLTMLIREYVKSDITIVESVKAAVAIIADHVPDLIIAPTLLSPQDSEELISHVKQLHAAPHVQMLTIPALDMLVEPPKGEQRGLRIFKRRPVSLGLQYDPEMVGALIADRLERAGTLRAEHDATLAMPVQVEGQFALAVRASRKGASAELVASGGGALHRVADDRRCAHRSGQSEVPWLSAVRLPWGLDVHLVNISRTGLLVESGSKLAIGVTLELHLSGPTTNLVVMARFVRSEVARVNGLGVRYYAAAQFEKPIDVLAPRYEPVTRSTAPHALAELLATVLAQSDHHPEPAQIRFARGFRALIRARDVLIRHAPIAPVDDSESIYFHVKGDGRSRVILQVMFEPDRALTASEFRLLKAAALLTAAVLELEDERPDQRPVGVFPRPVGITSLADPQGLTAA